VHVTLYCTWHDCRPSGLATGLHEIEIRQGKKDGWKLDETIMSASATQGGHNETLVDSDMVTTDLP